MEKQLWAVNGRQVNREIRESAQKQTKETRKASFALYSISTCRPFVCGALDTVTFLRRFLRASNGDGAPFPNPIPI
jgi:hypothetical protein